MVWGGLFTCSECDKRFYPHRERIFEHEAVTCGSPECQRKRKTRLQRERRLKQRKPISADIASVKQRRSSLPRRRVSA